jgi:hypothetical protein
MDSRIITLYPPPLTGVPPAYPHLEWNKPHPAVVDVHMGRIPSKTYLRKCKVQHGPHPLCYRCDVFVEGYGPCRYCDEYDQIDNCVLEWCEKCGAQ